MPETRYHLSYTVLDERGILLIRALWRASRGRVLAPQ